MCRHAFAAFATLDWNILRLEIRVDIVSRRERFCHHGFTVRIWTLLLFQASSISHVCDVYEQWRYYGGTHRRRAGNF